MVVTSFHRHLFKFKELTVKVLPSFASLIVMASLSLGSSSPLCAEDSPQPQQPGISIDYPEGSDIKKWVKLISLIAKKNIILESSIAGQIQIIAPNKVSMEEGYEVFLAAMHALGFTWVETSQAVRIDPLKQGVLKNINAKGGLTNIPRTQDIVTQVIRLQKARATEVRDIVAKIITADSLIAYEPSNTLIVSGTGYNVRRVVDFISFFDVKAQALNIKFIPIRNLPIREVLPKATEYLKTITAPSGQNAFKIFADERSNLLYFLGPDPIFLMVKGVVEQLDIHAKNTDPLDIFVRPLEFTEAKSMASTLTSLLGGITKKPFSDVICLSMPIMMRIFK